jgi:hypothetical protein
MTAGAWLKIRAQVRLFPFYSLLLLFTLTHPGSGKALSFFSFSFVLLLIPSLFSIAFYSYTPSLLTLLFSHSLS